MFAGLEIGGIASPNANHFGCNRESLWHCEALLADCKSLFK